MPLTTTERGRLAEDLAATYLTLRGYLIQERNFRFSRYEIDLVARRGDLVALVEVKYRSGRSTGGAAAALTREKKRFLEMAAVGYLERHPDPELRLRFDMVLVDEDDGAGRLVLRHVPGAWRAGSRLRA